MSCHWRELSSSHAVMDSGRLATLRLPRAVPQGGAFEHICDGLFDACDSPHRRFWAAR